MAAGPLGWPGAPGRQGASQDPAAHQPGPAGWDDADSAFAVFVIAALLFTVRGVVADCLDCATATAAL